MSPLAAITAIVLGSSVAIGFGLCAVLIIGFILRGESPQLRSEMSVLPVYCALFIALSAVSGSALYSLYKRLKWRWMAQAGMWLAVALVGYYSWRR